MWKNGLLLCNQQSMLNYGGEGKNYLDEIYLLGWSNSGYNQDTYLYVDDIVISKSPLNSLVSDLIPPHNLKVVKP